MPGIRDSISADASHKINFANLILRLLQLIFGATVIGFYASMYNSQFNKEAINFYYDYSLQKRLTTAVTVGALSVVTAIAFALIPALISYYYVATAFVWELIIFFIWCAVFGWFKGSGYKSYQGPYATDIRRLGQMQWFDLVNMLLWLATALMSVVCLLHDRKSLKVGRSGV